MEMEMKGKIIIRKVFKGSPIFIAHRACNEKIEGFGITRREALNDLFAWERSGAKERSEDYRVK